MVGAVAAYYKYGDRTDVTDKSLRGTKEALDGLLAYLGRALAEAVRPTLERILTAGSSPEIVAKELRGESFQNDVSSFVQDDIDEILFYRSLVHARTRWSAWSRRISWGVFVLLILQAAFTCYFAVVAKVLDYRVSPLFFWVTFAASGAVVIFCLCCAGVMLYYHDQISNYRDKVL